LTVQIAKELQTALQTEDVAVLIEAKHFCVSSRGIQDQNSATVTSFFGGKFSQDALRVEFLQYIDLKTSY
jgi:GTP cyclohydrolase I